MNLYPQTINLEQDFSTCQLLEEYMTFSNFQLVFFRTEDMEKHNSVVTFKLDNITG